MKVKELFINYFTKLFIVCICAVISEIICDGISENQGTVFSAVKILCSLCICLTVFSAFFEKNILFDEALKLKNELAASASSTVKTERVQCFLENTKKELEKNISETIFIKTGINPTEVCIQLNIESENNNTKVEIENVYLNMPDTTSKTDIYTAKKYVYDTLGCESVIEGEQKIEEQITH